MTWYVVDGMDGSGKSSVGDLIKERLEKDGRKVLMITHPNDSCRAGRKASDYLHRKEGGKLTKIMSTYYYILNVLHSLKVKRKSKKDYDDFIFVRYSMAVAYLPKSLIKLGFKFIEFVLPVPDVKIFVDIDPEIAMQRILSRGEELEVFETKEELTKTRNKMLLISDKWIVINNSHSYEQTVKSVDWVMSELKKKE